MYVITKNAERDIAKLDKAVQKRLKQKLEFYAEQENPLEYAAKLTGDQHGSYRWRIGNYRIIFDVDNDKYVILHVAHRREVYRR